MRRCLNRIMHTADRLAFSPIPSAAILEPDFHHFERMTDLARDPFQFFTFGTRIFVVKRFEDGNGLAATGNAFALVITLLFYRSAHIGTKLIKHKNA